MQDVGLVRELKDYDVTVARQREGDHPLACVMATASQYGRALLSCLYGICAWENAEGVRVDAT
jgi:hypothetical protein